MELLQKLHDGGSTICMVTHDMSFARLATRIVYLLDGRVVQDRATVPRYPRGEGPPPIEGARAMP